MTCEAKRHVVERVLPAETDRLLRLVGQALPSVDQGAAQRALEALLVGMDRYRVYVRPDEPVETADAEALRSAAAHGLGDARNSVDRDVLDAVIGLALGHDAGGPSRATGLRRPVPADVWPGHGEGGGGHRLLPLRAARRRQRSRWRSRSVRHRGPEFHAFAERIAADWPLTMTTLSTHDTKRSEDVRARLAVLSERPAEWSAWVRKAWGMGAAHRDERVDPLTEYLLWQTVVGAWPISAERLVGYATKAVREAKRTPRGSTATRSTKRPCPGSARASRPTPKWAGTSTPGSQPLHRRFEQTPWARR